MAQVPRESAMNVLQARLQQQKQNTQHLIEKARNLAAASDAETAKFLTEGLLQSQQYPEEGSPEVALPLEPPKDLQLLPQQTGAFVKVQQPRQGSRSDRSSQSSSSPGPSPSSSIPSSSSPDPGPYSIAQQPTQHSVPNMRPTPHRFAQPSYDRNMSASPPPPPTLSGSGPRATGPSHWREPNRLGSLLSNPKPVATTSRPSPTATTSPSPNPKHPSSSTHTLTPASTSSPTFSSLSAGKPATFRPSPQKPSPASQSVSPTRNSVEATHHHKKSTSAVASPNSKNPLGGQNQQKLSQEYMEVFKSLQHLTQQEHELKAEHDQIQGALVAAQTTFSARDEAIGKRLEELSKAAKKAQSKGQSETEKLKPSAKLSAMRAEYSNLQQEYNKVVVMLGAQDPMMSHESKATELESQAGYYSNRYEALVDELDEKRKVIDDLEERAMGLREQLSISQEHGGGPDDDDMRTLSRLTSKKDSVETELSVVQARVHHAQKANPSEYAMARLKSAQKQAPQDHASERASFHSRLDQLLANSNLQVRDPTAWETLKKRNQLHSMRCLLAEKQAEVDKIVNDFEAHRRVMQARRIAASKRTQQQTDLVSTAIANRQERHAHLTKEAEAAKQRLNARKRDVLAQYGLWGILRRLDRELQRQGQPQFVLDHDMQQTIMGEAQTRCRIREWVASVDTPLQQEQHQLQNQLHMESEMDKKEKAWARLLQIQQGQVHAQDHIHGDKIDSEGKEKSLVRLWMATSSGRAQNHRGKGVILQDWLTSVNDNVVASQEHLSAAMEEAVQAEMTLATFNTLSVCWMEEMEAQLGAALTEEAIADEQAGEAAVQVASAAAAEGGWLLDLKEKVEKLQNEVDGEIPNLQGRAAKIWAAYQAEEEEWDRKVEAHTQKQSKLDEECSKLQLEMGTLPRWEETCKSLESLLARQHSLTVYMRDISQEIEKIHQTSSMRDASAYTASVIEEVEGVIESKRADMDALQTEADACKLKIAEISTQIQISQLDAHENRDRLQVVEGLMAQLAIKIKEIEATEATAHDEKGQAAQTLRDYKTEQRILQHSRETDKVAMAQYTKQLEAREKNVEQSLISLRHQIESLKSNAESIWTQLHALNPTTAISHLPPPYMAMDATLSQSRSPTYRNPSPSPIPMESYSARHLAKRDGRRDSSGSSLTPTPQEGPMPPAPVGCVTWLDEGCSEAGTPRISLKKPLSSYAKATSPVPSHGSLLDPLGNFSKNQSPTTSHKSLGSPLVGGSDVVVQPNASVSASQAMSQSLSPGSIPGLTIPTHDEDGFPVTNLRLFGPSSALMSIEEVSYYCHHIIRLVYEGCSVLKKKSGIAISRLLTLSHDMTRIEVKCKDKRVPESFIRIEQIQEVNRGERIVLGSSETETRQRIEGFFLKVRLRHVPVVQFICMSVDDCEIWVAILNLLIANKKNLFFLQYALKSFISQTQP